MTDTIEGLAFAHKSLGEQMAALEQQKNEAASKLLVALGDASRAVGNGVKVTHSVIHRGYPNWRAIARGGEGAGRDHRGAHPSGHSAPRHGDDQSGVEEPPVPTSTDTSTAVAKREGLDLVKHELELRIEDIAKVLPKGMSPERFVRVSILAFAKNPDLIDCVPSSVVTSIIEAAEVGLEPTGSLNRAWLVPFRKNQQSPKMAQLMIGYQGYADLIRLGDTRRRVVAEVVYEGDHFKVIKGTETPRIEHEPAFKTEDPTKITHAYAIVFYPDGTNQFEVMTRQQIELVRAKSRQRNGPAWTEGYGQMSRKSALRRLSNYTPLTPEAMSAIARDDEREYGQTSTSSASRTADVRNQITERLANRGKPEEQASDAVDGRLCVRRVRCSADRRRHRRDLRRQERSEARRRRRLRARGRARERGRLAEPARVDGRDEVPEQGRRVMEVVHDEQADRGAREGVSRGHARVSPGGDAQRGNDQEGDVRPRGIYERPASSQRRERSVGIGVARRASRQRRTSADRLRVVAWHDVVLEERVGGLAALFATDDLRRTTAVRVFPSWRAGTRFLRDAMAADLAERLGISRRYALSHYVDPTWPDDMTVTR
jgi:phage RecT family recombinase